MSLPRPDLNGSTLFVPGASETWLMLHGQRRLLTGEVNQALFKSPENLQPVADMESILRGPDLNEGTCLVRSKAGSAVYLVTGFPSTETRRHHIDSYETFLAYGFDNALVRIAPPLVLAAVQSGRPITMPTVKADQSVRPADNP